MTASQGAHYSALREIFLMSRLVPRLQFASPCWALAVGLHRMRAAAAVEKLVVAALAHVEVLVLQRRSPHTRPNPNGGCHSRCGAVCSTVALLHASVAALRAIAPSAQ